jgi:hypothetical protein
MDANFTGANLERAPFNGANLNRANLRNAKLQGAKMVGVQLNGAVLPDGAIWQRGEDLSRFGVTMSGKRIHIEINTDDDKEDGDDEKPKRV